MKNQHPTLMNDENVIEEYNELNNKAKILKLTTINLSKVEKERLNNLTEEIEVRGLKTDEKFAQSEKLMENRKLYKGVLLLISRGSKRIKQNGTKNKLQ